MIGAVIQGVHRRQRDQQAVENNGLPPVSLHAVGKRAQEGDPEKDRMPERDHPEEHGGEIEQVHCRMAGFKSHYHTGYEYKLDDQKVEQELYAYNWLSPSYSDLSVGIDWKPNDIFTVYLSPIAGRITTATDTLLRAKYGVPLDKTFKA